MAHFRNPTLLHPDGRRREGHLGFCEPVRLENVVQKKGENKLQGKKQLPKAALTPLPQGLASTCICRKKKKDTQANKKKKTPKLGA